MSKLYRVYGKNINRPAGKGIEEITASDLREEIDKLFSHIFDEVKLPSINYENDSDVQRGIEAIYQTIVEYWDKNKILECGDYEIIESDEIEGRPNMCGFMPYSIDEIESYL